jgi:hypothetical protein
VCWTYNGKSIVTGLLKDKRDLAVAWTPSDMCWCDGVNKSVEKMTALEIFIKAVYRDSKILFHEKPGINYFAFFLFVAAD